VQVKISSRHGHLTDDAQKHIKEKVEKLLHFHDRISMIEVTVDLHHNPHTHHKRVEILVNAEHKHDFVAHSDNEEINPALDEVIEKIKHQLTRYKEKIQDHRRDPSHGDNQ
jgi:putative sigma-54 modulation protein